MNIATGCKLQVTSYRSQVNLRTSSNQHPETSVI